MSVLARSYFPNIEVLIERNKINFFNFLIRILDFGNENLPSRIDCVDSVVCDFKIDEVLFLLGEWKCVSISLGFRKAFIKSTNMNSIIVLQDENIMAKEEIIYLSGGLHLSVNLDEHLLRFFSKVKVSRTCQNCSPGSFWDNFVDFFNVINSLVLSKNRKLSLVQSKLALLVVTPPKQNSFIC